MDTSWTIVGHVIDGVSEGPRLWHELDTSWTRAELDQASRLDWGRTTVRLSIREIGRDSPIVKSRQDFIKICRETRIVEFISIRREQIVVDRRFRSNF